MSQDFGSFVERYQLIYEKDPNSKVFAPLAEAYRRMGLLEEAIDLAERGVKKHPHFASGRVALGKCFSQRGDYAKAIEQLETAVELSPENLLAHQIIADCYLKLKKFPESLRAYKMILFLNPSDKKAAHTVATLEKQLHSTSYWGEEDFNMEKLTEIVQVAKGAHVSKPAEDDRGMPFIKSADALFEREMALLDARLDRGDWSTAQKQLTDLLTKSPRNPALLDRKKHIDELTQTGFEVPDVISPMPNNSRQNQIKFLQNLLTKIESRRKA